MRSNQYTERSPPEYLRAIHVADIPDSSKTNRTFINTYRHALQGDTGTVLIPDGNLKRGRVSQPEPTKSNQHPEGPLSARTWAHV